MNREIKFRIYDKKRENMWSWESKAERKIILNWINEEVKADGEDGKIIMQYTGLFDKNGVEIYEGDIVRVLDRGLVNGNYSISVNQTQEQLDEFKKRISVICEVVYKGDSFILEYRKGNSGNYNDRVYKKYGRDIFEIIGNIYENPELLIKKII